jgi:hypothetical protein
MTRNCLKQLIVVFILDFSIQFHKKLNFITFETNQLSLYFFMNIKQFVYQMIKKKFIKNSSAISIIKINDFFFQTESILLISKNVELAIKKAIKKTIKQNMTVNLK